MRGRDIGNWVRRLWWFDVVYPITVALLIFCSLTYIVYAGQRSSRLSLLAEQSLLETSLTLGKGRPAKSRGAVLVVSADTLDIEKLGRAPLGVAPEPTAAVFATIVEVLARAGVRTIFVGWHLDAHPNDDAYYAPLVATLKRLPPHINVRFVMSSSMVEAAPMSFRDVAKTAEDDTCNYPDRLQSDCPFKPSWPEWVMQAILVEAVPGLKDEEPVWVTHQMPSIAPSYVMNLPAPESLPTRSFSSLLAEAQAETQKRVSPPVADVAFVGTDLSRSIARTNDSSVVRFVRTAYDPPNLDANVAGTPLHVFWAMASQMFHDRAMVTVPPEIGVLAMTVGLCMLVMLVMAHFGAAAASGMFLVYVMSGPIINAWTIRVLNIYAPLFDSYYFGLSTFIVGGFGRLSYGAFQRWRLAEQRRMHEHTADMKGNFISLLSHNLNTPVAKMQGMLGLLASTPGHAAWKADVRLAEFHVTQLEYAIRSVLIASAVEEGSLSPTPRSLKAILEELDAVYGSSLKRLGLDVKIIVDGEDELVLVPLDFDVRALTASLAGLAALFAREGQKVRVDVRAAAVEDGECRRIHITVASAATRPPDTALRILADAFPATVRSLTGHTFFSDVLAGLGVLATRAYDGTVVIRDLGDGVALEATYAEPAGSSP